MTVVFALVLHGICFNMKLSNVKIVFSCRHAI